MLDLERVAPQIAEMAQTQAHRGPEQQARIAAAVTRWRAAAEGPAVFARLPRERTEPRLALPGYEPLDYFPAAPDAPERFAILAVDGSQIEPDFHEVAPCYLINVGHALLRYGPGAEGTRLGSEPTLFYPEQMSDVRQQITDVRRRDSASGTEWNAPKLGEGDSDVCHLSSEVWDQAAYDEVGFGSWGDLDGQRMLAEANALADLLQGQSARQEPALAFLDGPLIAWRLDWISPQAARWTAARNFLRSFDEAKRNGIPLAGYISRTRSTDLVNLLKFSACRTAVETAEFCAACAAGFRNPSPSSSPARRVEQGNPSPPPAARVPGSPARRGGACYEAFDGVMDRHVLERVLTEAGMRSPVFVSNSSVLANLYGEHRYIGFFYLNTGDEIGRVEVPQWVWEDPERLATVHALVYDQVRLGRGYPIALSEAHEQAVVRASDRHLFYELIRRAYGRSEMPVKLSGKAVRKRGPIA